MFRLMHEMRVRIMTAPAFIGAKVIAAILFEGTMDGQAQEKPVPAFLWEERGVIPFLKVDKGLEAENDGVNLMKPMPALDALLARARRASSAGIGFIRLTPSFSASSPLSTLRKGITPRSSHRKAGTGFSWAWPSIVPSKRIAAITLAPMKAGAVMIRTRISCISLNISASPL